MKTVYFLQTLFPLQAWARLESGRLQQQLQHSTGTPRLGQMQEVGQLTL